jgi:hypothetical protein
MGSRGKPRAMQYDWTIVARKVLDFYEDTLNRVKRPGPAGKPDKPQVGAASGQL